MMMNADSEWSATAVSMLYPHHYRIQIHIPQELTNLDNSAHVPKLQQIAEEHIRTNKKIQELCKILGELAEE